MSRGAPLPDPRRAGIAGSAIGAGAAPESRRARAIRDARAALHERRFADVEPALRTLLRKSKEDPEALFLMGLACEAARRFAAARAHALAALKAHEHPDVLLLIARLARLAGQTDDAVERCDRALALRPDDRAALTIKAGALEEAGRFDEARAIVRPLVEAGSPSPALRYEWAKLLVHEKRHDEAVRILDDLIADERLGPENHRLQLHLRAKACDRMGDYAAAHDSAGRANRIGELEFSPQLYEEQVSALIEIWSKERMAKFPISRCDSELPVFVAGMPRSGTSLIDQIIDAHPSAAGVGELSTIESFAMELSRAYDPDLEPPLCFGRFTDKAFTRVAERYVREVAAQSPPGAQRIVNKALGNNKLVGLIARLFPRTRIIHAVRDPRDVAVSCYMGGFNNALHPWTTRFEWIASAWEQSRRMMDHWKASLDVPILEVRYEELVRDPEAQFPRLIEFLGLDWDDRCLEFHRSRRTVRTLSYDQVNRPLYTTSAGRHERYAPFMQGVDFPPYPPA